MLFTFDSVTYTYQSFNFLILKISYILTSARSQSTGAVPDRKCYVIVINPDIYMDIIFLKLSVLIINIPVLIMHFFLLSLCVKDKNAYDHGRIYVPGARFIK